jgi:hypothetical protein
VSGAIAAWLALSAANELQRHVQSEGGGGLASLGPLVRPISAEQVRPLAVHSGASEWQARERQATLVIDSQSVQLGWDELGLNITSNDPLSAPWLAELLQRLQSSNLFMEMTCPGSAAALQLGLQVEQLYGVTGEDLLEEAHELQLPAAVLDQLDWLAESGGAIDEHDLIELASLGGAQLVDQLDWLARWERSR